MDTGKEIKHITDWIPLNICKYNRLGFLKSHKTWYFLMKNPLWFLKDAESWKDKPFVETLLNPVHLLPLGLLRLQGRLLWVGLTGCSFPADPWSQLNISSVTDAVPSPSFWAILTLISSLYSFSFHVSLYMRSMYPNRKIHTSLLVYSWMHPIIPHILTYVN